jgi:hypothetical protein
MSDISENITESIERAKESKLNTFIAVLVAISATFVAIFNIKDNNIVQGMSLAQARAIDSWSFYQAKSTKQHLYENTKSNLEIQLITQENLKPLTKEKINNLILDANTKIGKYEKEKEEIKLQAEGYEKEYDALNIHDDQFDMAEALLSLSMAVFGITALTQKKSLFVFGLVFSLLGIIFGISGFLGWNLHPEWLAKLLG